MYAEPFARGCRRRCHGLVREDDTLRLAGRSAGRHHERVTGLDVVADSHRIAQLVLGSLRKALIDRECCITGVPHAPQLLDEPGTAGYVESDEAVHVVIGLIGVIVPTSDSISAAIVRQRRSVNRSPIT